MRLLLLLLPGKWLWKRMCVRVFKRVHL